MSIHIQKVFNLYYQLVLWIIDKLISLRPWRSKMCSNRNSAKNKSLKNRWKVCDWPCKNCHSLLNNKSSITWQPNSPSQAFLATNDYLLSAPKIRNFFMSAKFQRGWSPFEIRMKSSHLNSKVKSQDKIYWKQKCRTLNVIQSMVK